MDTQTPTQHVVIGTAGHIDHGKTSLIKALTGRDLDKLSEEKRRGITIELGFAFYGERAAFVDVPGHEKLVKTMIAGASAMNAALLVIAADDGVMPQTREHLTVLDVLGVRRGLVAVTKADLVEEEWLELVIEEVRELLEGTGLAGSALVAVDSLSGRGLDELRAELDRMIDSTPPRETLDFFRLPVDRSFVIRGHGRVVTGTVWNGTASSGDKLRLLPGGQEARVRGVQAHEDPVDRVQTGDRAALNLAGDLEPERGQMLASAGRGVSTDFFDAAVFLSPDTRMLKQRARVRVHVGTAEVIGRLLLIDRPLLQPGDRAVVRLALEQPVAAMHGDLGVLRFYSPMETLGGFRVLDPDPPDRKRSAPGLAERLAMAGGDPLGMLIESRLVLRRETAVAMLPWTEVRIAEQLSAMVENGRAVELERGAIFVHGEAWTAWKTAALDAVTAHHQSAPNEPGLPAGAMAQTVFGRHDQPALRDALIAELVTNGDLNEAGGLLRRPEFTPTLEAADEADAERVHNLLLAAGLNPPVPSALAEQLGLPEAKVRGLLKALRNVGRAVILEDKVVLAAEAFEEAKRRLATLEGPFKLGEATTLLETSRKVGVPLMERLDKEGVTVRDGDLRRVIG